MSENRPTLKQFHAELQSFAGARIAGFRDLPPSDPARMMMESVAEFASGLYDRVRPETEKLFETLPEYLGLERRSPEPTRGVVKILRTQKDQMPITLPHGTECFADTAQGIRRFVTESDLRVVSYGSVHERYVDGSVQLGISSTCGEPTIRIFVKSLDAAQPVGENLVAEGWTGSEWRALEATSEIVSGSGFITVSLSQTPLSAKELDGTLAVWIRLRSDDGAPVPAIRTLLNAVTVREEQKEDEVACGAALALSHQAMTLPVVPLHEGFTVRIEGDRNVWNAVPSLAEKGPADCVFRYDSGRNAIVFGDGRHGAVAGPSGRAIFIRQVVHSGSLAPLAPLSIRRIRADHTEIAGVEQPMAFDGGGPTENEEARLVRFRAELFTQRRAFSLKDYERIALAFSPDVSRAMALSLGSHEVQVVVAPREGKEGSLRLADLQQELAAAALVNQTVKVMQPEPVRLKVEMRLRLKRGIKVNESLASEITECLTGAFGALRPLPTPWGGPLSRAEIRNAVERHQDILEVSLITLRDARSGRAMNEIDLKPTQEPVFEVGIALEEIS